jgi:hypothetical protein
MPDACKRLWSAVLEQAISDVQGDSNSDREEARKWLLSENYGTASFLWICDVLGLEPNFLRNAYRNEWNCLDYCKVVNLD